MDYKDYYATLEVAKDASKSEVQKAYRKLARKYHPDVNKDPDAEAKFKEINEAHEVLKDPDKRAKYDRFGSAWNQTQTTGAPPPPGYEDIFSAFTSGGAGPQVEFDLDGEGFSSFFDVLFGSGRRPAGAQGGAGGWEPWQGQSSDFTAAGANSEATIRLTLEEAGRGGKREFTLTDPATGKSRTLRVTIPKGIRPGQRIRLAGQGGPGAGGGPRGDLYLSVELLPDPRFRLEGRDLHTILPVTPWEAALGGEAKVKTLDREVRIKVPPGSSSGRRIRLRGKGFPSTTEKPGDLFAEIRIVVPEELSARERELFDKLAEESKFKARD